MIQYQEAGLPIPLFREDGWLPVGHHPATWEEVEQAFGGAAGSRRRDLFERLVEWRDALRAKGVSGRLLLDGSFVSTKEAPGDVDALFVFTEEAEITLAVDSEAHTLISHGHLKEHGIGDVFCFAESSVRNYPVMCRLDGFDVEKHTSQPKGLVEVPV